MRPIRKVGIAAGFLALATVGGVAALPGTAVAFSAPAETSIGSPARPTATAEPSAPAAPGAPESPGGGLGDLPIFDCLDIPDFLLPPGGAAAPSDPADAGEAEEDSPGFPGFPGFPPGDSEEESATPPADAEEPADPPAASEEPGGGCDPLEILQGLRDLLERLGILPGADDQPGRGDEQPGQQE